MEINWPLAVSCKPLAVKAITSLLPSANYNLRGIGSNPAADRFFYVGVFSAISVNCSLLQGSILYSGAIRKGKCSVFHVNVMINGDIWLFEFIVM